MRGSDEVYSKRHSNLCTSDGYTVRYCVFYIFTCFYGGVMADRPRATLKAFCQCCGEFQEIEIEPLRQDKVIPENGIWGDIICKVCRFVMLTFSATVEGDVELFAVIEEKQGE